MTKGINYWAFPAGDDGTPLDAVEAMRTAKRLGYDAIELTAADSGPVTFDTPDTELGTLRSTAEEIGIELVTLASGFAWATPASSSDAAVGREAEKKGARMIEIAAALGVETVLYIPGVVSATFAPELGRTAYAEVLDRSRAALERLLPKAEEHKVKIGIENVWNRFLLDPISMRDFIDRFGSPWVGSYFDVGNVMLYGHPEDWIRTLGKRICAVHMKDFRVGVGNLDGFVDLLAGDVDFPAVMDALAEIGYDGPYTVEYVPGVLGAAEKGIAALKLIETMRRSASTKGDG